MTTAYELRERAGLGDGESSLPFLRVEREMPLPDLLHLADILSGKLCASLDVTQDGAYLVTCCGGSPYWWLPGTHGGGMHQIRVSLRALLPHRIEAMTLAEHVLPLDANLLPFGARL